MLWPLLNHCALALFAQRTRIPTFTRSIGFCAIWVCISSSSSSTLAGQETPFSSAEWHCIKSTPLKNANSNIQAGRLWPSGPSLS